MNSVIAFRNHQTVSDDVEQRLLQIRSDFVTWAANRQMFETICLFSQVKVVVTDRLESLAAISNGGRTYLYLHRYLIDRYHVKPEFCFFVIMHELRHLYQSTTWRDWSRLLNFAPLFDALSKKIPREVLERAGITDLENESEIKHDIFNLAADAAIHEDLVHIFGSEMIAFAADFITERERDLRGGKDIVKTGLITVDYLKQMTRVPLESGQDWLYYAKHLIDSLSTRISNEPDLAMLLVERQILKRIQENGIGKCDLNQLNLAEIDFALGRANGESKKMMESYINQSAAGPGTDGLDFEETHLARNEINAFITKVMELARSAVIVGRRSKIKETKSFARPHNFIDQAPGRIVKYRETPHRDAVIVLDTSGSMWFPELLEQMANLVVQLRKRDLLLKAYCCDVVLHKLEMTRAGNVKFKGSGGTTWTRDHHTQILEDLNMKRKITIYYCTDGEVNGLADALEDERVTLEVINVPQLINEQAYIKAKL